MPGPSTRLRGLTDADVQILRQMVESWRQKPVDTGGKSTDYRMEVADLPGPETLIAYSGNGIPAIDNPPGSGPSDVVVPGKSECEIYHRHGGTGELEKLRFKLTVHNVSRTEIPADEYVKICQDRFGDWIASWSGGGGGGGSPLTVEEVDGSPTIPNVTKIRLNQADGYQLVNEGSGTARLNFSSSLTIKEADGTPILSGIKTIILNNPNLVLSAGGPNEAILDTAGYNGPVVTNVVCNGDGTITLTTHTCVKGVVK